MALNGCHKLQHKKSFWTCWKALFRVDRLWFQEDGGGNKPKSWLKSVSAFITERLQELSSHLNLRKSLSEEDRQNPENGYCDEIVENLSNRDSIVFSDVPDYLSIAKAKSTRSRKWGNSSIRTGTIFSTEKTTAIPNALVILLFLSTSLC